MADELLSIAIVRASNRHGQAAANLGAGIILGIVVTLGFQYVFLSGRAAARAAHRSSGDTVPAAASPSTTAAQFAPSTDAPTKVPVRGTRSASDWERVAAQYGRVEGDPSLARSLLYRLDPKSLRKLAAHVATWPRGRRNQRILGEIFRRWGELDPRGALARAQALPNDLGAAATDRALDGFAENDAAAASAYLAAPPAPGSRHGLRAGFSRSIRLGEALQRWAEDDPAAAAGFVAQLPKEAYRPYILDSVAEEWTRRDPAAALRWAQGLGVDRERTSALSGVVTAWTETDPAAAANYVLGLSGNPAQDGLLRTLGLNWAYRDQEAAARWVAGQAGHAQAQAAAAVAEPWTDNDPTAASDWAGQLPPGEVRNAAWKAVGSEWYLNDPGAAQAWLGGLPAGEGRDAAIVGFTQYWMISNRPGEVLGLVQGIGDPRTRADTLVSVLNQWLERDAQPAKQWINQASLPSAVTGKLSGL